jgi:hypothetical protein
MLRTWLSTVRSESVAGVAYVHRVEVRLVGAPPAQKVERASGVSHVEIDGPVLRCMVTGSFQPFLDSLLGHEVLTLDTASEERDT